jgi:hypothetical protein
MGCRGCTWTTHLTPGTDRAWAAYADHLAAALTTALADWLADEGTRERVAFEVCPDLTHTVGEARSNGWRGFVKSSGWLVCYGREPRPGTRGEFADPSQWQDDPDVVLTFCPTRRAVVEQQDTTTDPMRGARGETP